MEINLTTPALLFPAVSLLMLAYTNRFLALAALIRSLHATYRTEPTTNLLGQIENLRRRIVLIRNMQALGVFSMLLAVLTMFLLFERWQRAANWAFAVSLLSLMASLLLSLREIQLSIEALKLQLRDMESGEA
jgi:hypothetical protein